MKMNMVALALSVLLPISAVAADQTQLNKRSDLKANVHYKFLVMAKKGELKPMSNGACSLTLSGTNIAHYRATAPDTNTGNISLEEFSKFWAQGKGNSFKNDPPNAFVASNEPQEKADGTHMKSPAPYPYVVTLKSVSYKNGSDTISFECKVVSGGPTLPEAVKMKYVALIVDDFSPIDF